MFFQTELGIPRRETTGWVDVQPFLNVFEGGLVPVGSLEFCSNSLSERKQPEATWMGKPVVHTQDNGGFGLGALGLQASLPFVNVLRAEDRQQINRNPSWQQTQGDKMQAGTHTLRY